jgi:hypothetical protein
MSFPLSPDILDKLKIFGIPGLGIIAIVSLIYIGQSMWRTGKSLPLLTSLVGLSLASIVLIVFFFTLPTYSWVYTNLRADWGADDADCTASHIPAAKACDGTYEGRIAVCWDYRPEGYPFKKCGGTDYESWCTYKRREKITLEAKPSGTNVGLVYICARRFP